jgi:carbamoyl-phosphate synthase large subunit
MGRHHLLITSASKKIPLIKAAKEALELTCKGDVIAADQDPSCLARHFVTHFWQMPSLEDLKLDQLISECHKRGVAFIIPTRDGELPFFAKHKKKLQQEKIHVMISDEKAIDLCLDKLLFFQTLESLKVSSIPTALDTQSIPAKRWVVKERFGSGAKKIALNVSEREANEHAKSLKNPIFQPYIEGKESSIDLYVTQDEKVHGSILRTRDLVVDGESQVTTIYDDKDQRVFSNALAQSLGLSGHVMFQTIQGKFVECNPRVGGASTLSFKAGLQSLVWFIKEGLGEPLPPFHYKSTIKRLIRYPEDWIL